jgi:HAD superfamily hydrolase (TIGR01509 family)
VNIKAVIYDMDGVLIDSMPFFVEIVWEMAVERGCDITKEKVNEFAGSPMHMWWDWIVEEYRLEENPEKLTARVEEEYARFLNQPDKIKVMSGVVDTIKWLNENGYKVAIASSSPNHAIKKVYNALKLKGYVNSYTGGNEVAHGKPFPDVFIETAHRMEIPEHECLVIEDSTNGIKAANLAGMTTVAYKENGDAKGQNLSESNYTITEHGQLKELLTSC